MAFRNEIVLPFVHLAFQDVKKFIVEIRGHKLSVTKELLADVFYIFGGANTAKLKDIKEPIKTIWETIFPRGKKGNYDPKTKTWDFLDVKEHWNVWFFLSIPTFAWKITQLNVFVI
jgi:hypothetical protein